MDFIKKNIKYLFIFIFFVVALYIIFFENTSYDFLWTYGFSHALKMGEIPYVDFNTISTPLYIMIMSLFLKINDSFLMFIIIQSLFCTIFCYLLFKYIDKKAWIILTILALCNFVSYIGTYNFLTFFLFVLLFYLEDNKKSDYFIGLVLGFLFLSKHTIGGVTIIFNLILLLPKFKTILKRIVGAIIPILLFTLYLIITKSLMRFIDLCVLGLFDFASNNGGIKILFFISIFMLASIIIYYKKSKDIKCSYLIGAFFFPFPIFDIYHFFLYLSIYVLLFINNPNFKCEKIEYIFSSILVVYLLLSIIIRIDFYKELSFLKLNHFKYYLVQKNDKEKFNMLYKKYNSYNNSIMVGTEAMLFDIASNKKITYFDMPLTGNYGYNGTKKMINKVKKQHNNYYFINICTHKKENVTQLDFELIEYIINNSKKVDEIDCYGVYYK